MKSFVVLIVFSIFVFSGYCATSDFKELRSDHFVIFSARDVEGGYVDRVKDMAENFYRSITQEFNLVRDKLWLWENRAKIYIAKDRESYLKGFPCPGWSAACVDYNSKVIYTYSYQEGFSSVLAHELTHIIFREYIGAGNFPLWLDEGMAMYVQNKYGGGGYFGYASTLKKAIQEKKYISLSQLNLISVGSLSNQPKDYVDLFYIESLSLIDFLVKRGPTDNFHNFLYYLRNGANVNEALSKAFSSIRNMEDLEKQWIRFYQE